MFTAKSDRLCNCISCAWHGCKQYTVCMYGCKQCRPALQLAMPSMQLMHKCKTSRAYMLLMHECDPCWSCMGASYADHAWIAPAGIMTARQAMQALTSADLEPTLDIEAHVWLGMARTYSNLWQHAAFTASNQSMLHYYSQKHSLLKISC